MPKSGTARSYSNSIFNFLSSFHTVLHSSCTNFIPISSAQRLPFLHILTNNFHHIFFMIVILTRYMIRWKWKVKAAQSCPSLCNPMDQARMLEWVAIPFPMGSSQPRDETQVSCIAGKFFASWVTREALIMLLICISFIISTFPCTSWSFLCLLWKHVYLYVLTILNQPFCFLLTKNRKLYEVFI